jgi:hypothetical protein
MGIEFKKRGYKYSATDQERLRAKLIDAKIMEGLIECWQGNRKLDKDQLAIGLKTFDKLLPNLASQELSVTETQPFALLPAVLEDVKAWQATFKPALPKPETEH